MVAINNSDSLPAGHPTVSCGKIGVLLINLGTPQATDYWSMRRYLKQFLWDKRVIDVNRVLWWFILNFIILTFRPKRSGAGYDKIWNTELDESPLRTITRQQSDELAKRLKGHSSVIVDWAMRYGEPSIASKISALHKQGCSKIVLAALYPQYAGATTATAYDDAMSSLQAMRWQPAVRTMAPYHDHAKYITTLGESIREELRNLDWEPEKIVVSFHGVPKRYLMLGDPYHCHCQKTVRLLKEYLGDGFPELVISFQSLFGKEEWLKPYTEPMLIDWAQSGTKRVAVITPGFSADCIETLEEIAIGAKEAFLENGGEKFHTIPCLNASPSSIDMIETLIMQELSGWL